jgi:hypothetical protein
MDATTAEPADAPVKRRRKRLMLSVWALPEEKEIVDGRARGYGLSTSSYLLRLGMGNEPQSTLDQEAVQTLAKLNGDQGRLGGLLKLLLTNEDKLRRAGNRAALVAQIESVLSDVKQVQERIRARVNGL